MILSGFIYLFGGLGTWYAPRHWWGWALCTISEILWFVYALTLGATTLAVFAIFWFALNLRAMIVSRRGTFAARDYPAALETGSG